MECLWSIHQLDKGYMHGESDEMLKWGLGKLLEMFHFSRETLHQPESYVTASILEGESEQSNQSSWFMGWAVCGVCSVFCFVLLLFWSIERHLAFGSYEQDTQVQGALFLLMEKCPTFNINVLTVKLCLDFVLIISSSWIQQVIAGWGWNGGKHVGWCRTSIPLRIWTIGLVWSDDRYHSVVKGKVIGLDLSLSHSHALLA